MIVNAAKRLAESHPYLWRAAWTVARASTRFMPHDPSYAAIKHFQRGADGLILDIGANDGISALAFRRLAPRYRVLSLEPNRLLEPYLKAIEARDPMFRYRMVGAGEKACSLTFHIPTYRGVTLHTFTSTDAAQVLVALKNAYGDRIASRCKLHEIIGEVVTIDSLEESPSIIKIDAEGFDYEVLLGAQATIEKWRPFVIVEAAWADLRGIRTFFRDRAYKLLAYSAASDRFGDSGEGRNLVAIPEQHLESMPLQTPM